MPDKNMMENQNQEQGQDQTQKAPINNENAYNDKDMMNDMLLSMKALSGMYNTFIHEASSDAMVELVDELHADIIDLQRDLFDTMNSLGWYQLEQEDENKITQTIQQFEQERPQLSA